MQGQHQGSQNYAPPGPSFPLQNPYNQHGASTTGAAGSTVPNQYGPRPMQPTTAPLPTLAAQLQNAKLGRSQPQVQGPRPAAVAATPRGPAGNFPPPPAPPAPFRGVSGTFVNGNPAAVNGTPSAHPSAAAPNINGSSAPTQLPYARPGLSGMPPHLQQASVPPGGMASTPSAQKPAAPSGLVYDTVTAPLTQQPWYGSMPASRLAGSAPNSPSQGGYSVQLGASSPIKATTTASPAALQFPGPTPPSGLHGGAVPMSNSATYAGQQRPPALGGFAPPPPVPVGANPTGGRPAMGAMQPPTPGSHFSTIGASRPPAFGAQTQHLGAPGVPQPSPSVGMPPPGPGVPQPSPAVPTPRPQQSALGGRTIDPGSMPRPSPVQLPTQIFETRRENTHTTPPPCDVPIVVQDKGSAGPRYLRSTLNSVPQGADLLKSASLPFVVFISPLAIPHPSDSAIEVVNPGPAGPLRCAQCKAYVCPYMQWTDGGRRMTCCFCSGTTDVPPELFAPVGVDGMRHDGGAHPELCRGSVEFQVGGEYQVRPPAPPTFLFLIEVTAGAVGSGATAAACSSLAALLDELPGGDRARVCVVTFDARVHFYAFPESPSTGNSPRMLVLPDARDPFCPLGSPTVRLGEYKEDLRALLVSIPVMFTGSCVGESAGGAALRAAVAALQTGVGGRLLAFLTSLPHSGALALRPREAGRPPTERDNLDVMTTEGKEYAALAAEAAEHQVSVDVFALSQGYVDLATLSLLCAETSGSMHRYNPFSPVADGPRFHDDLRWTLVRPQGLEAVGRLRASQGLAVDAYAGALHRRNPTDLHFAAVSCEHTIAAKLVHEERLREGSEVYLQYALLYSTMDGDRRVRVHTLALPVTRSLGTVFRNADLDAYVTYVARKVSGQLAGRTIAACRDVVIKSAVDTLLAYRRHVAATSSSGQLILPESLKLLPLYALGLTKLPCFRTDARADSRAVWASRLLCAAPERVIPTLYPRLVPLLDLQSRDAGGRTSTLLMPERLWLTAEKLDPEGIFFLENGYDAYIYVGAAVSPEVCASLLGVPSPDAVDPRQFAGPPALETPLSKRVGALLDECRKQRRSYMHLRLMRRGHPQEAAFLACLVEDRSLSAGSSYVEFLCALHRQIQNKLT